MSDANRWAGARRIEEWAGEARVNLFRLAAILVFYAHHLINVYAVRDDPNIAGAYHLSVTALVIAWSGAVVALYLCLTRRWVPPWLKYAATTADIVLVTALLIVAARTPGDPRTWLATLYVLVIAAAPLRLSLPLIYFATLGSMAAYGFFLGYVKYWLELPPEQRLSRPNQIIFALVLGATGILTGQLVRQARRLTAGYPVTVEEATETLPCHTE
jgi:hypothetical protein